MEKTLKNLCSPITICVGTDKSHLQCSKKYARQLLMPPNELERSTQVGACQEQPINVGASIFPASKIFGVCG
jgi:hypothetical protein